MVITITVLPIPGRLTHRGLPGWLALVLTILVVVLALALVIATVFFAVTKLAVELPAYLADAATTATQELPAEVTGSEADVSTTEFAIELGPVVQGAIAVTVELLVQFGMALFIFFFMISAAISLPGSCAPGSGPACAGCQPHQHADRRHPPLYDHPHRYQLPGGAWRYRVPHDPWR